MRRTVIIIILMVLIFLCAGAQAQTFKTCKTSYIGTFKFSVSGKTSDVTYVIADFVNNRGRTGGLIMEVAISTTQRYREGYSRPYDRVQSALTADNKSPTRIFIPVRRKTIPVDGKIYLLVRLYFADGSGTIYATPYMSMGTVSTK